MNPTEKDPMRLADRYPDIARLTLFVAFEEADAEAEPNYQQIIFTESSVAAFRLDCSREECIAGGFDYAPGIDALIRSGEQQAHGKIACQGSLGSDAGGRCCALQSEYRIIIQR